MPLTIVSLRSRALQARDGLRSAAGCERGTVAVMFAMMLTALCLFVGAAVDIGRWIQARHQTIAAMDAAVLAGGRILQLDDSNVTAAKDAAARFYAENTKGRHAVVEDTIAFDAVENKTAFAATGNAYLETSFLRLAHIPKLPLLDKSEAQFSKAVLRAGGNGNSNSDVEISMMLDVTGSMGGSKITDLKKAASDLVDIVISTDKSYNSVRVAIVPFAEALRLPSSVNTKARGTPADSFTEGSGKNAVTYYKTDCVVERKGTNKFTDVAPGTNNYVMTQYLEPDWWGNRQSCGLGTVDEVMPLSNDKTALKAKINGLQLSGGTAGQLGTAWAWYMLSPNWNSLWSSASAASAYGAGPRKIAILMTDGEYNTQYNTKGVSSSSGVNGDSTTQARTLCTNMKAKGITVYTVGFALGGNATAIETLSKCATDASMAYKADSGAELQQAFRDIALKINQLYLTH